MIFSGSFNHKLNYKYNAETSSYHLALSHCNKYQSYNEMKQCKSDFKFKCFFKGRLYISELEHSCITDIKVKSILCKSPASNIIKYVQGKKKQEKTSTVHISEILNLDLTRFCNHLNIYQNRMWWSTPISKCIQKINHSRLKD